MVLEGEAVAAWMRAVHFVGRMGGVSAGVAAVAYTSTNTESVPRMEEPLVPHADRKLSGEQLRQRCDSRVE